MLSIFHRVAESTPLLICVALVQILSVFVTNQKTTYLMETFGGNEPPDLWFGIEAKRLYSYLAGIGSEGRAAYLDLAYWDVVPAMPTYTVLLGSLVYRECQKASLPTTLSLLFLVTMTCDAIETIGCGYVTKTFPTPLKAQYMDLISNANVMKWVTLVLGTLFFGLLFLKNLIFPKQSSLKADESKTKKDI